MYKSQFQLCFFIVLRITSKRLLDDEIHLFKYIPF